jgi:hypothetical protein
MDCASQSSQQFGSASMLASAVLRFRYITPRMMIETLVHSEVLMSSVKAGSILPTRVRSTADGGDALEAKRYVDSADECVANRWRALASSPVMERCGV